MNIPPKILPPKMLKQQIFQKKTDVTKVPLSSARPLTEEKVDLPAQDSQPVMEEIKKPQPPLPIQEVPEPRILETIKPLTATPSAPVAKAEKKELPLRPSQPSAPADPMRRPFGTLPMESQNSLPVLSAFQEFLDNERERTRRRILAVSISYLLALLLIVAISLTGGTVVIRKLRNDFTSVQDEVKRLQALSLKIRTDADTLSQRLSSETMQLRTDMDISSDSTKSNVLARVSLHGNKLDKIDVLVQALQKENTLLRNDLLALQTRMASITNNPVAAPAKTENHAPPLQVTKPAPLIKADPVPVMVMSILPKGLSKPAEWRIPIPE